MVDQYDPADRVDEFLPPVPPPPVGRPPAIERHRSGELRPVGSAGSGRPSPSSRRSGPPCDSGTSSPTTAGSSAATASTTTTALCVSPTASGSPEGSARPALRRRTTRRVGRRCSPVSWLGARSIRDHQLVGVALGLILVVLAGMVGRRYFNPRVGLIAAGVAALYPGFWLLEGNMLSEPLGLALLGVVLLLVADLRDRPTWPRALLVGLVSVALALTGPEQLAVAASSSFRSCSDRGPRTCGQRLARARRRGRRGRGVSRPGPSTTRRASRSRCSSRPATAAPCSRETARPDP